MWKIGGYKCTIFSFKCNQPQIQDGPLMHDLSQVRLKVAFHMRSYNHAATISRGLMLLTGSVHTCPPWVLE